MKVRALLVSALAASVVTVGCAAPASAADNGGLKKDRMVIGKSVEERNLVMYRRWHEGATKRVLVVGNMHGDEPTGRSVVRRLRHRDRLPANLDLWLLRTMNPDGNAAFTRTNARGVDLNRNWPYRWRYAGAGTRYYSGPKPKSEPETRAVRSFVRDLEPDATIVFHEPLYGVGNNGPKKIQWLARELSEEMDLPLDSFKCYSVCRGTFTMWHNKRLPGAAVTVEFGTDPQKADVRRAARAIVSVGSRLPES